MSVAILLKVFSDCCICFAILGSGPISFEIPLLFPAMLCGLSAGIAAFFDGKYLTTLRKLCAILPLGCLLFADSLPQGVVLAVPACYTAFVILRGKLELEYYEYRRYFLRSLALVGGVYAAMQVWIFLSQIANETIEILQPNVILRYGLVHLVCGIVLQRQLRLGYSSQGNRRQIVMMIGSAIVMIFCFVLAEPLLRKGAGAMLLSVVSLLVAPLALLVELIAWLLSLATKSDSDKDTYEEFIAYIESIGLGAGQGSGQAPPDPGPGGLDPRVFWVILAVVFLVIAALVLIRSFRKLNLTGESDEVIARVVDVPKKKRAVTFSNRGKVRQLYREFLKAERNLGMKRMPNYTSQDVLEKIHTSTNRPSADDLRQVYLSARYDERNNISREQVEQAKRALKGTRQSQ